MNRERETRAQKAGAAASLDIITAMKKHFDAIDPGDQFDHESAVLYGLLFSASTIGAVDKDEDASEEDDQGACVDLFNKLLDCYSEFVGCDVSPSIEQLEELN